MLELRHCDDYINISLFSKNGYGKCEKSSESARKYFEEAQQSWLRHPMMKLIVLASLASTAQAKCPFHSSTENNMDNPHVRREKLDSHRILSEFSSVAKADTTNLGCTCKSTCGATLDTGFANCDWCWTEGGCGRYSVRGLWDFCRYPEDLAYENQTAAAKLSSLWADITADTNSAETSSPLIILAQSVQTSFDNARDVVPEGRTMGIHSVGTVCKFDFLVAQDSPYTGLLAPGSRSQGLVRMGPATEVTRTSGLIPGLGIKLMRTGVPSGNFVALVSLNPLPDESYNFFQSTLSNHIPPADSFLTQTLAEKFKQASSCPTKVGLSEITAYDVDGIKADSNNFPFKIEMVPKFEIENTPMTQEELMDKLTEVPVNVPLFDIYAYDSPLGVQQKLGSFTPNEACVTSKYGDASLFVRHQRIEEDWALRPEWLEQMDPEAECDIDEFTTEPPVTCSEMYNFEE